MTNQNIFKRMYVAELRDKIRSGESLCDYFKKDVEYPIETLIQSTIKTDPEKLKLKYRGKNESASNDLENAIALYEAFPDLTETQASDPRLWTYLTHVTLRDYVFARWPIGGSCEQIKTDSKQQATTIDFILSHWFASGGNDRLLRRNAAARLWWPVHLTHAPWLREPEFFADLKTNDPYRFTKILLSMESIYAEVLERGLGRDNRILITVLEFFEANKSIKREQIRSFMKELNLFLSVRNLSLLSRKEMKETIFDIGNTTLKE
ncbi:MAG: DUF6339 family protein [Minisyncoccia bacterium]